jgi:CHAD domain-containing protein
MSFKKDFKIKGLDKKARFSETAAIVLNHKLQRLAREIDRFFKDDSTKNLHIMRIAFRRFRYILELYCDCLPPRLFKHVCILTKDLQDLIGIARDLDVMEEKILMTSKEIKQKIPKYFIERIQKEKIVARQNIKLELIKFISNKDINKLIF